MIPVILQLKEKRERLLVKQQTLRTEARGIARDIPVIVNPSLSAIEEMDVARAANMMDDLVMKQGELLRIQTELWDLEEQLGQ